MGLNMHDTVKRIIMDLQTHLTKVFQFLLSATNFPNTDSKLNSCTFLNEEIMPYSVVLFIDLEQPQ